MDLLRSARDAGDVETTVTLSATDPANPYGVLVPWPMDVPPQPGLTLRQAQGHPEPSRGASDAKTKEGRSRRAGARVVLVNGQLAAWIGRGDRQLLVSLPADEPERARTGRALARELVRLATHAPDGRRGWLIEDINGQPAAADPSGAFLMEQGFTATSMGLQLRVAKRAAGRNDHDEPDDD